MTQNSGQLCRVWSPCPFSGHAHLGFFAESRVRFSIGCGLIAGANWLNTSLKILISFWDLTVAGSVDTDGLGFKSAAAFPGVALIREFFLFSLGSLGREEVPDS
jgi:hypothetical protein